MLLPIPKNITLSILDMEGMSESRNHINSPSTKGKSTKKSFVIKSKILSIAKLNKVHLNLSAGYMIILKSSKKHQAKSHHDLTMSSYAYIASLRFSLVGPHTPSKSIQSHLPHPSIKLKMKILQPYSQLS